MDGIFAVGIIIIKYSLSTVAKIVTARRVSNGNRSLRRPGTAHNSISVDERVETRSMSESKRPKSIEQYYPSVGPDRS